MRKQRYLELKKDYVPLKNLFDGDKKNTAKK